MADLEPTRPRPLLEVAALWARSNRSPPIRDIGFAVEPGTVTAVLGPAGSGRGTLLDALAGRAVESRGVVRLAGRDLMRLDLRQRRQAGIALLEADGPLLPGASIGHGMALARALARRPSAAWLRRPSAALWPADWREIRAALERTGLRTLADGPQAGLPPARRRALQLAQALVARPRLLLLDHPWRGLTAPERAAHAQILASLGELNIAVLIVDSDLLRLSQLADRALVLAGGHLLADATPAALAEDERVAAAFLGAAAG
jgi:branched-chain amino acid transport system ATP-binding protein